MISLLKKITVHPTPNTYFDVSNTNDSVTCHLYSDAYAQVVAENGINIFTYEWDDPSTQTTQQATGLAEGLYTVTITDNQGCTTTNSIEIKQPFRLTPDIDSTRNVSCFAC